MVPIHLLLLPILLSSVFVFIVSSIIHMVLPWHKGDYPKLQNEEKVMDALRSLNIPDGEYIAPRVESTKEMSSPEFKEKMKNGPVFILNILGSGSTSMGKQLAFWFLYSVVIGIFCAYIAGRALPAGANYLHVFRFAGTTAFLAYSAALWQEWIWWRKPFSITLKNSIDGLIYALVTAGTFGWLWPQ